MSNASSSRLVSFKDRYPTSITFEAGNVTEHRANKWLQPVIGFIAHTVQSIWRIMADRKESSINYPEEKAERAISASSSLFRLLC
jgi:hypothetical protein